MSKFYNHADDLQEVLVLFFFFYVRSTEIGFQHIGLSFYVSSKDPTHEDILSIYALYIYSVHIYLYAKVLNDQYQQ